MNSLDSRIVSKYSNRGRGKTRKESKAIPQQIFTYKHHRWQGWSRDVSCHRPLNYDFPTGNYLLKVYHDHSFTFQMTSAEFCVGRHQVWPTSWMPVARPGDGDGDGWWWCVTGEGPWRWNGSGGPGEFRMITIQSTGVTERNRLQWPPLRPSVEPSATSVWPPELLVHQAGQVENSAQCSQFAQHQYPDQSGRIIIRKGLGSRLTVA